LAKSKAACCTKNNLVCKACQAGKKVEELCDDIIGTRFFRELGCVGIVKRRREREGDDNFESSGLI